MWRSSCHSLRRGVDLICQFKLNLPVQAGFAYLIVNLILRLLLEPLSKRRLWLKLFYRSLPRSPLISLLFLLHFFPSHSPPTPSLARLSSPSPLSHTTLGSQGGSWPGVRTRQDMWAWSQRPGTEEQEGSPCGVRGGTNSILYHSA